MAASDAPNIEPSQIDRAISSSVGADGTRNIELTTGWNTPNGTPNGGYVLGILLWAVLDEASSSAPGQPDPLSISVNYFKPASPGPATVQVGTLRLGRSVSVFEAALLQNEAHIAHAIVALHNWDCSGSAEFTPIEAPPMPPPEDCIKFAELIAQDLLPIVGRYDVRVPQIPGWFQGKPSNQPEDLVWVRPSDARGIDAIAAAMIVDGYPPVTAEIGLLAAATVQLTVYLRRRPETDWALMHLTTRHVIDGFAEEDVELWDDQGRLIAQSRQLALLS